MRDISSTRFSIIGTNAICYINNFLSIFNSYNKFSSFSINSSAYEIIENGVCVFKANSDAVLRQNIQCWICLGLMERNKDILIKIIEPTSRDKIYEYIKTILLVQSPDQEVNTYRNTILIKLLFMDGVDVFKKNICTRTRVLDKQDIKKSIGKFEEFLMEDKKFIEIIKIMWGDLNE